MRLARWTVLRSPKLMHTQRADAKGAAGEVDGGAGAVLTCTRVLSPWVRPGVEHLAGG
jgi:hypothetical protein